MVDIRALDILAERKASHSNFLHILKSKNDFDYLTLSKDITSATQKTSTCIGEVNTYASKIAEEISRLRKLVKDFTIKMSEKMNSLMESGLIKGFTPFTGKGIPDTLKREDFDIEKAQNLVEMQKIVQQQLELQKIMNETNDLLREVEENGTFTLDNIENIQDHLKDWTKTLETEKERKRRIEEENEEKRKLKEMERRKKEADEKLRKEEEKRKREEVEKQKQEEKRKKKEEEDRKRRIKEETEEKRKQEEKERRKKEAEKKRRKEEEVEKRKQEEKRKKKEEEGRKRRIKEEAEEKRKQEEEERRKKEADEKLRKEEVKRKQEEEEKRKQEEKRKKKEEEERKRRIEEEAEEKRKQEEKERIKNEAEEKRRKMEEEEKRKQEEKRKKEEEKRKRRIEEEAEEKRKQEEKERIKKEAEEKRRKEEEEEEEKRKQEEKRRKEEEQRKKEEEKRRKEQEESDRKRRDPKNWPTFIYDRAKDNNLFHKGICCVVSAITGSEGLEKDDITCSFCDSATDLERCRQNKEEIIMSSLIKISSKTGKKISLELPMRVYVPRAVMEGNRQVKLKLAVDGGQWQSSEEIQENPKINMAQDVQFAATSVNKFQSLELIAVSRPLRQNFIVKSDGGEFEPSEDKNVKITVPKGCFQTDTCVHFKVDKDLAKQTKAHKDMDNIKIATSLLGIEFGHVNQKDIQMEIYADVKKIVHGSAHQKALGKCNKKLVTDISVLDVASYVLKKGLISEQTFENIKSKKTDGMKARRLLEEFKDCNHDEYTALKEALVKANQGHLAQLLDKTLEEMKEEDENMASDFVGEVEQLQIVSSCHHGDWKILSKKTVKDIPDAVFVSLPANGISFDIMGLVVPKNMNEAEICRIAELLYQRCYHIHARLILRQNSEDPFDGFLRCVESAKCASSLKEMKEHGYTSGPPESAEFGLCDGEELQITTSGNIIFDSCPSLLQMTFYLNMDSARATFKMAVVNKKAQALGRDYSGELMYNVGQKKQNPPRSGSMVIHLPKAEELQRYAPLTLDVSVKVCAKFVALLFSTRESPNVSEFYSALVQNPAKLRSLRSRAQKQASSGTDREFCEVFIMNWANQRPRSEDKVNTILKVLCSLSQEMSKETEQFCKPYSLKNGILSNNSIEEMANLLENKWDELGKKLGMDPADLNAIEIDFKDDVRRAVRMFDQWRLSYKAVEQGTNVTRFLFKCVQECKCSGSLLTLIKDKI